MAVAAQPKVNGQGAAAWRVFADGRLQGMRNNRYTWWQHWRELADFFLPRRYKWLITPNQQSRGSPINQHILDSSGVVAARNLAAGIMSGKTSPLRPWFFMRLGQFDSTQTSPVSLWLSDVERIMRQIFNESNFYQCVAQYYYDLVIFGTAVLIIYEDFQNVINCFNPCAGEYYVDIDGKFRPVILYREFTMTIAATVNEFGYDNCSADIQRAYDEPLGVSLTREIIIAHAIEPNDDGRDFGVPKSFAFREAFWQCGESNSTQTVNVRSPLFLRVRGYQEQPHSTSRWDLVSNDPYGRSVAMDALPDEKQLMVETRRKGQAIDKMVNPPLVADVQLKNQPASQLPGGMTYVNGFSSSGKPGIASIYNSQFPVNEVREDLDEVRDRLKKTFYNDLFQPISQFETRSNVTAFEIDSRKAESLIMLGPVFTRIDQEGLRVFVERTYAIASRVPGLFPPPPPEIAGMDMSVEFVSMLANAQDALQAASIERCFSLVGNIAGVNPQIGDNIDWDFGIDKYSKLMNNDPRLIRTPEATATIRQQRAQQQQAQQQAAMAQQLSAGAKNLASADMGNGQNALQQMVGSQ